MSDTSTMGSMSQAKTYGPYGPKRSMTKAEELAAWRRANPDKVHAYNRRSDARNKMRRTYGITTEQLALVVAAQGGGCSICGRRPDQGGPRLVVDHDHSLPSQGTEEKLAVRGVLCSTCNTAIGKLGDDPRLCIRAMAYLMRWNYEEAEAVLDFIQTMRNLSPRNPLPGI